MTIVFIIFVILAAIILLPSQLFLKRKALNNVVGSLDTRLNQLKLEYQFRSKELKKRLKNGELAQEEWQQMNQELELDTAASIESTKIAKASQKTDKSIISAISMLVVICLIGLFVYQFSETRKISEQQQDMIERLKNDPTTINQLTTAVEENNSQITLEALFLALRTNVDLEPEMVKHWRALAMFNARVGRASEAYLALNKAIALEPINVDIQVELAQLYASSKNKEEQQRANQLLTGIMKSHPDHEGAKLVYGFNAFNLGFYQKAIDSWQLLIKKREPGSESVKMLQNSIDVAKEKIHKKETGQSVLSSNKSTSQEGSNVNISVKVEVSPAVLAKLTGDEVVFVYVKAIDGPRFPLAAKKLRLSQLSKPVVLSDADAMKAEFKLSQFSAISINARVSLTGNAIAQTGDIKGQAIRLDKPFTGAIVKVIID